MNEMKVFLSSKKWSKMSQNLSSAAVVFVKDKDKEALFNVAYNVTDNISSQLFCDITNISLTDTYLPYSIFLAQPLLCERQQGSC